MWQDSCAINWYPEYVFVLAPWLGLNMGPMSQASRRKHKRIMNKHSLTSVAGGRHQRMPQWTELTYIKANGTFWIGLIGCSLKDSIMYESMCHVVEMLPLTSLWTNAWRDGVKRVLGGLQRSLSFPVLMRGTGIILGRVYLLNSAKLGALFLFFICHWNWMQSRQKGCGWINVSHILLFFQVQYLYFLPPIATIVEWEFEQLWWFTVIHLRTDFSWSKVQRTPANLWFVICNFIRLRILLSYFLGGEPILPY